jgi:hypothetical protein
MSVISQTLAPPTRTMTQLGRSAWLSASAPTAACARTDPTQPTFRNSHGRAELAAPDEEPRGLALQARSRSGAT